VCHPVHRELGWWIIELPVELQLGPVHGPRCLHGSSYCLANSYSAELLGPRQSLLTIGHVWLPSVLPGLWPPLRTQGINHPCIDQLLIHIYIQHSTNTMSRIKCNHERNPVIEIRNCRAINTPWCEQCTRQINNAFLDSGSSCFLCYAYLCNFVLYVFPWIACHLPINVLMKMKCLLLVNPRAWREVLDSNRLNSWRPELVQESGYCSSFSSMTLNSECGSVDRMEIVEWLVLPGLSPDTDSPVPRPVQPTTIPVTLVLAREGTHEARNNYFLRHMLHHPNNHSCTR